MEVEGKKDLKLKLYMERDKYLQVEDNSLILEELICNN